MPRRRSYASKVPTQQKKPTKPVNQTKVPAVPSKQPTSVEQRSPGLFGQIASTAAGVAIGNTISRGLFSGGSSSEIPASQEPQTQYSPQTKDEQPRYSDFQNNDYGGASCEADAKALTKCLELNNHDISLCQFYLENLKACQQMASRF